MAAMLLNSSDPHEPHKKLFLPFLSEQIYGQFESKLSGKKIKNIF